MFARILGIAAFAPLIGAANAQCNFQEFITYDSAISNSSDVVRLAFLTETMNSLDKKDSKAISDNLTIPGYGSNNFSSDERKSLIQRQYRMLGLNLSSDIRKTLITSTLSSDAAKSYQSCLEANKMGLRFELPPQALYAHEFQGILFYRPGANGQPLRIDQKNSSTTVLSGPISIKQGYELPNNLLPDSSVRIPFVRTGDDYFEVGFNFAGLQAGGSLPDRQKSKLSFAVRNSEQKIVSSSKPNNGPKKEKICIAKEGDEVFFPETAIAVEDKLDPNDRKRNHAEIEERDENRVCMAVFAASYDDFTGGYTAAHISVISAKTVPIVTSKP